MKIAPRRDFALLAATQNKALNGALTMRSTIMKSDTREAAEARYLEALNAFVSEANRNNYVAALVEALTWTLARIAVGYGTPGTADILGRLGRSMTELSERHRARDEASRAREAGELH